MSNIYCLDAMNDVSDLKKINPLDPKWKNVKVVEPLDIKRRDAWSKSEVSLELFGYLLHEYIFVY